jgi:L-seryl-tRNA(Ser) seleniumtransferase
MDPSEILKDLPAIGRVLDDPAFADLVARRGRGLVTALLRQVVDDVRSRLQRGDGRVRIPGAAELARRVEVRAAALLAPSPRTVVNATGVVAHTNLGRSVLSAAAAQRVAAAATGYLDLEFDLERGSRGDRMAHLDGPLAALFPGTAAVAVNNNAGAILLALRALARGREVVVSRGELVEIGGAFRVPDILALSGARLREVGTTNRTRIADYEAAVGPKTGAILKVHTSNFKIVGFACESSIAELSALARAREIPLVVDWGSGDLVELAHLGVHDETPVGKILAEGSDLVTFSCDKLLGGPQAGLAIGRDELIRKLRRDPLARVLRLDRLQIAALRETLAAYVGGVAFEEVPTLRMLALDAAGIGRRAEAVGREAESLAPGLVWRLVPGVSRPGGGSSPMGEIPTVLLALEDPSGDAGKIEVRLRRGDPPVVARVSEGRLLFDLRTVLPEQDASLARRIAEAARGTAQIDG